MFGKKDAPGQDSTTLDELIRRVTLLQADVSRIENEWRDLRDQIRRGYQRLEKAHQRLEAKEPTPTPASPQIVAQERSEGPHDKLQRLARRAHGVPG